MKKHHFLLGAVTIAAIVTGFVAIKYRGESTVHSSAFYPLKQRTGVLAQSAEAKEARKQFDELLKRVRTDPADTKSRIALASLYIQEARVSGMYAYYHEAAMKYIDEVLTRDDRHFEALTLEAAVLLSQHQFEEGLATAEKARAVNPDNAFVYGLLIDGNVEMGHYKKAVEEAEKMIAIRPDIRSYSRISYLREIHGDLTGAIEAMKLAVDAGMPGDEATEWARVQFGHLYEHTGQLEKAEMNYLVALERRPGYAYAIAGLGRVAMAKKEYDKAIDFFKQAASLIDDHSFEEEMAKAYKLAGDKHTADSILESMVAKMTHHANHEKNGAHEHFADLEIALLYVELGNYGEALEHAMVEYRRRPLNIEVNELLAWIYYNRNEYEKALPFIEVATGTQSKDAVLRYRAALIYAKTGNKDKAKLMLDAVDQSDVGVPALLREQAVAMSQGL